jgi:hypothetical protein
MAEKTTKTDSSPKSEAATSPSKTESSGSSSTAPANYSRGEGQKLVTQAYRDNWAAIFGKPAGKASKKISTKRKPAAKPKKTASKKPKRKTKR